MAHSRYSAGIHAVARLVDTMPDNLRRVYVDERVKNPRLLELTEAAKAAGVAVQRVRNRRLDDMAKGTTHQGVVAEFADLQPLDEAGLRSQIEATLGEGGAPLLLLLDGVQDPHNLGACLRTAEAAGVMAVIVPKRRSAPLTPAARKVASGAAELVPLVVVPSLARTLDWLGEYGVVRTATSDQSETPIWSARFTGPAALVLGAEDIGVATELAERCDASVRLPMAGQVESLNVSVATGICLFEAVRQRTEAG